jgi:hypothetical protein
MSSESESESDGETSEQLLGAVKGGMTDIDALSRELETSITSLFYRVKCETTDWMTEPLNPRLAIGAWCAKHGLPANPSVDSFMDACFEVATSIDLETRMLTFSKEDAGILWSGRQRLSVFDIIASLPTLFY